MKQRIFAGIATGLIVFAGVIAPAINFVAGTIELKHAYAECTGTPCLPEYGPQQQGTPITPLVTPTYYGPGGGPNGEGAETDPSLQSSTETNNGGGEATGKEPECGQFAFGCQIMSAVATTITSVPFFLATLAGLVSDYAIWYSLQSSTYTSYDGTVGDEGIVVTGWKLVRDFSNLLFIFALFVIAFTLILGLDERAEGSPMGLDPKRTIARVIIMALLVNFSFFLGRSVIDITNVVALTFYNKITVAPKVLENADANEQAAQQDVQSFYANAPGIRSITSGILAQINPQRFILNDPQIRDASGSYTVLFFIAIMSAVFGLFLVYLFLNIAILFISRTIGLFLGIIISPIAFVSYTIPALQKKAFIGFDDWLKQFLGLAFMAPVFLFFLYIALQFFKISLTAGSGMITIAAQVLVQFLVVGILLIYAKNVAKDLSGKMGEMTSNALTSIATGAATVAGVVATGGISGAARLGGRMAKEKLLEGASGFGKAAVGEEKFAAMSKQWDRAGGFSMLKGRGIMSSINTVSRVATAGSAPGGIVDSFKAGKTINRRYDIANTKEALAKAKADKEKKDNYKIGVAAKEVDKKLENLKKDLEAGIETPTTYNAKRKALAQERKEIASSITDPTFAENKASKQAAADKTATEKTITAEKTGENLARAQTKVIDLGTKLSTSTAALTDATTKLAAATKAREDADKDVDTKKTALTNAKTTGEAIAKNLADVEKELAAAPKTGFGVDRDKLAALEERRKALLEEKNNSATEIGKLGTTLSGAETLRSTLVAAETAAANTKNSLETTIAATKTEKATAESERNALQIKKAGEDATLADAKATADAAAEALKAKKQVVDIQEEIRKRSIVSKTDTGNRSGGSYRQPKPGEVLKEDYTEEFKGEGFFGDYRQGNKDRIKTLQEKLRDITGGGV